ncbi:L-xylulose reductase-like [Mercenaria mercenaria]|uniref:L-xylulose reductase-like n=1 Tax=Mercenaria mercenaria TaxID=6596 RepID=UPI00234F538F|nr:L-xylulose reductase-like [Mercenaria mercenaria]
MEETEFKDKRALVTGAGKGIGRGIAVRLANLGTKVYAISRTQTDLDNLKQEVPSVETRLLDISDWETTRKVVTKGMATRGTGGAVVNISSIAGIRTTMNHSCYSTSKAALDMLTLSLTHELGPKKIRVNSVNPTVVMTEMGKRGWNDPEKKAAALAKIPVGRFAEIEDIVNATVYLLSDKSSMINGVVLPVDGGMINSFV